MIENEEKIKKRKNIRTQHFSKPLKKLLYKFRFYDITCGVFK